MSKLHLAALVIGAFLTSSILSVWISCWTLPPVMAIDGDSFELQLRLLDGTPIEHFDWGEFSKGQTKQLEGQLVYSGPFKAQVMWNTTNFPSGWSIEVWDASKEKIKEWPAKSAIKLIPGEILPIRIVLSEVNGVPDQLEAFSLNFMSLSKIKT
jgi:hypothetical protein